jgi:hypothetical protein
MNPDLTSSTQDTPKGISQNPVLGDWGLAKVHRSKLEEAQPGVVVHTCNPSTQEAEAGGLCSRLAWAIHTLSQNRTTQT